MSGNINSNFNPFIKLGTVGYNNVNKQSAPLEQEELQDTQQSNVEQKNIPQDEALNWMAQMGALNIVSSTKTSGDNYIENVGKYISPERAKDIEESMAKFEALYEQTRATTEQLFGDKLSPAAIDLVATKSIPMD